MRVLGRTNGADDFDGAVFRLHKGRICQPYSTTFRRTNHASQTRREQDGLQVEMPCIGCRTKRSRGNRSDSGSTSRHFPDGLSRETLQAGNASQLTIAAPPPCLARGKFLSFFLRRSRLSAVENLKTGRTGAFFSMILSIGADRLRQEPLFPRFDPLPRHVT